MKKRRFTAALFVLVFALAAVPASGEEPDAGIFSGAIHVAKTGSCDSQGGNGQVSGKPDGLVSAYVLDLNLTSVMDGTGRGRICGTLGGWNTDPDNEAGDLGFDQYPCVSTDGQGYASFNSGKEWHLSNVRWILAVGGTTVLTADIVSFPGADEVEFVGLMNVPWWFAHWLCVDPALGGSGGRAVMNGDDAHAAVMTTNATYSTSHSLD